MLQQHFIFDNFDQKYLPVNYIQPSAPIKFSITSADYFYLDFDKSLYIVCAKISKTNGTDIINNVRAAPINLLLFSLFRDKSATMNEFQSSDSDLLYLYRAYQETILNYRK